MKKNKGPELEELRGQIDVVDTAMLALLARRMKLVERVGSYKRRNGLPVLDKKRMTKVRGAWIAVGKRVRLPGSFVADLFKFVHRYALSIEKKAR